MLLQVEFLFQFLVYLVNDFEIIEDNDRKYVYFCGEWVNDTLEWVEPDESGSKNWILHRIRNGVWGYFLLTDWTFHPGFSINCQKVDTFGDIQLSSLNNIEVLPVANGLHVFMTGTTQSGQGCILDVMSPTHFPSSWDMAIDTSRNNEVFDDVALLDNYLVVTSRRPNVSKGYVNLFKKPTSYNNSTIATELYRGELSYAVDDTLILTHCESDTFATGTYSLAENGMVLSGYDFTAPIYSIVLDNITTLAPNRQMQDISYNKASNVLDVLQHMANTEGLGSIIWHLDQTLGVSGTLTTDHKLEDNTLHSITCLNFAPNYTVASGHSNDGNHIARLTKLKNGISGECTENLETRYNKLYHTLRAEDLDVVNLLERVCPDDMHTWVDEWPISDKCRYNKCCESL